jgi:hypothetical protein
MERRGGFAVTSKLGRVARVRLLSGAGSVGPVLSTPLPGSSMFSNVLAENSGIEGGVIANAGSTPPRMGLWSRPMLDSNAFFLATSNTSSHSISCVCVSACRRIVCVLVLTSKQKRRSSCTAGFALHSNTPISSPCRTPCGPCTNHPKMPSRQ